MTEYTNYTTANISGFTDAFSYTQEVVQTATGYDLFVPIVVIMVFGGFFIISLSFGIGKAFAYSSFMTTIALFLLVAANIVAPIYLIWAIIFLALGVFLL